MGRPAKDESRCKRHPKHRQSVGVCPFCLRERLSHLTHPSSSSSAAYLSSSSASSSTYSTSDSDLSSYASTPPHHCDVKRPRPKGWLLPEPRAAARGGKLTKSLSLVFVVRSHEEDEKEKKIMADHKGKEKEKTKKKKSRFWSKLLSGSNGRQKKIMAGGALLHSHTFKEKPSPKLVLFA